MESRLSYIDVAKGVAMLLVVMHHCGGSLDRGMEILTMVDVPLFFLCSGYLAYKQTIDFPKEIIKKTKGILMPFVIILILMSIIRKVNVVDIFIKDITKSGYWFLEALYLIFLLWWGTVALCRHRAIRLAAWGGGRNASFGGGEMLVSND
ncbi:MAG: acyltransferase family protein [Coprobacter sp.]|nr:acyltransferase family protein [Coprobacter sp.]